jgi:preprotein translocase subunit YajC
MLISTAYAQAAGGAPSNDFIVSLMPLVLIFVVFYFLMIRPQQQKVKQHRDMVENLKRGDQVVTGGGILGKVTKVEAGDQTVIVEIAPNVQVRVSRATITEVMGKPATNDNRVARAGGTAAAGGMGGLGGLGDNISARLQRFFKR